MPNREAWHQRSNATGSLLLKLIVVMVIIGMLAGIVTLSTRRYLISAKQNTAKAEISKMVEAIDSFYAEHGRYPTNEEGLEVLVNPAEGSGEGYLKKINEDPWKHEYEYNSPGRDNLAYEVLCLGGDGREGGEGGKQRHHKLRLGSILLHRDSGWRVGMVFIERLGPDGRVLFRQRPVASGCGILRWAGVRRTDDFPDLS